MRALLTSFAVTALLVCGQASAQEQAKEDLKTDQTVPKSGSAGGQNMPDQNAKQEGSSKVPTAIDPSTPIFVDGRLTVPGAPDGDTVPAKHSARTNADDQLPIAAYATRHIAKEKLQAVRNALSPKTGGGGSRALDGFAQIGAIVPTAIALDGLQQMPADLAQQIPSLAVTSYVVSEGKILLVNPRTRVVVGVLE